MKSSSLLALSVIALSQSAAAQDWASYGNDKGGTRYSSLAQIKTSNVKNLRNVWTFHTGEPATASLGSMQCNPIIVHGIMYVTTAALRVYALKADTGKVVWRFDPATRGTGASGSLGKTNRGVAYWTDGANKRILLGTADARLFSLDANTGIPDPAFGANGMVDLTQGLERTITGDLYGVTSAPVVFENLVILGFLTTEFPGPAAPGDVRAFDVRTGAQVWKFRTVPQPGETGNETWAGTSWQNRGGVNNWSGASLDVANGLVFVATGAPAFDFYGGDRAGNNLFANCVLALNARTGERVWHSQLVHHDLWDYDVQSYPLPLTVTQNGIRKDVVVQVTKTGFVWVFDRLTGVSLFPIVEHAAPSTGVAGEVLSATQPAPVKPAAFAKQGFFASDVTDISPDATAYVQSKIAGYRYGQMFTPPSLKGTVHMPGILGGATWSGASFDPQTGLLYVNSNNVPWVVRIRAADPNTGYGYQLADWSRLTDQNGYPGVKPPWGVLSAIDVAAGEIRWQVPLGEYPELTAKGIPVTGTENIGGNIVTAGGLIFVGSTRDAKFRAFDKTSGDKLWEYQMPAGGYALPSTYMVQSRQYVVIAAGGGGKFETPTSDAIMAFALPTAAAPGEEP